MFEVNVEGAFGALVWLILGEMSNYNIPRGCKASFLGLQIILKSTL